MQLQVGLQLLEQGRVDSSLAPALVGDQLQLPYFSNLLVGLPSHDVDVLLDPAYCLGELEVLGLDGLQLPGL